MVDTVTEIEDNVTIIQAVRFDFRYLLNENLLNEYGGGAPDITAIMTESVHLPLRRDYIVDFTVLSGMQVLMSHAVDLGITGYQLLNLMANNEIIIEDRPLLINSFNIVYNHIEDINLARDDFLDSLTTSNDLIEHEATVHNTVLELQSPIYAASLLFIGGVTFLAM